MKLDNELVLFFKKALRTAQMLKFDGIVIEQECVRGWNDAHTAIIADNNVPKLPFNGIGINRIPTLLNRMGLLEDYTVDVELINDFVMALTLKSKNATVKYRCANPNTIKSPKTRKDKMMWTIEFSPDTINQLSKADAIMGSEFVNIKSNDGICTVSLKDSSNDIYKQNFNGYVDNISNLNENLSFDFFYDAKMLMTLLKNSEPSPNVEGEKGSIKVSIGQAGSIEGLLNSIVVSISTQAVLSW